MTTLTVTAEGQVTFREAVLKHLGVQPGGTTAAAGATAAMAGLDGQ